MCRPVSVVLLALALAGCGSSPEVSASDADEEATSAPEEATTIPPVTSSTSTTVERAGDPAVWQVDATSPPSAGSDSFTASVTRASLTCSSGVTGEVLEPALAVGDDEIVVTFTVAPLPPGPQTCPSNEPVAHTVQLGEPIGTRSLVDGGCATAAAASSDCSDPVRWRPGDVPSSQSQPTTAQLPQADPFDEAAEIRPELMVIDPAVAAAGDLVELTFPRGTLRGVAFTLERAAHRGWAWTHLLSSRVEGTGGGPSWAPRGTEQVWVDLGVEGTGPDLILLPDDVQPGEHRICTANAGTSFCGEITIT